MNQSYSVVSSLRCGVLLAASGHAYADVPDAPALNQSDELHATSPFARFFGTWTLADDQFQQVWDTETLQTLEVANHITQCSPINTNKSVLCVVDAGDLKGHILWAYDDSTQQVRHLSHFV